MPALASAGRISSLSRRYWRSTMPWARAETWRNTSSGAMPSGPVVAAASLICSFSPETRISKNSSRLEETMQRKRRRSSSGTARSSAWASTRRLNSRACSSRLRKCSCDRRAMRAASLLGFLPMTLSSPHDRLVTARERARKGRGCMPYSPSSHDAENRASSEMEYTTLGAVDLGSNSFHLAIGRGDGGQIYTLDSVQETERLGGGLTAATPTHADPQQPARL